MIASFSIPVTREDGCHSKILEVELLPGLPAQLRFQLKNERQYFPPVTLPLDTILNAFPHFDRLLSHIRLTLGEKS